MQQLDPAIRRVLYRELMPKRRRRRERARDGPARGRELVPDHPERGLSREQTVRPPSLPFRIHLLRMLIAWQGTTLVA